jgi:hypothetical protein
MALDATIGGDGLLFVGEDKIFKLELLDASDVPVDMTGWTLLFDVRVKDKTPDPALISKTPMITGVYNAVRATNTQRAVVTVTDTDMNLLKARTYRHSWKRMDDGSETVLAWGDFVVQKATAP